MSEKPTAYGASTVAGGDTSFRKKYDREEYATRAAERESKEKSLRKAHYESKVLGHKQHTTTITTTTSSSITPPSSQHLLTARSERINLEENLNKTTLVASGSSVGKRGKGPGFYCETCDLTFKDSLQWVDHLNSKQHIFNSGLGFEVERATLEDVKRRLEILREKKRENEKERNEVFDLKKRLEERERVEEEERRVRREKRKEKRKLAKMKKEGDGMDEGAIEGEGIQLEMEVDGGAMDADMETMKRMMGFAGGFASTKKG